jgi:F-type H+-transporting ATPase subunit epsilon
MATELQLVVVTPETTLIDEPVTGVRFPLFDGSTGVLPGHAPLVGRVGSGELSMTTASGSSQYFVDGGFVQIVDNVVTLLTARCMPTADVDKSAAQQELDEALARPATSEADIVARQRDQDRARSMLSIKQ